MDTRAALLQLLRTLSQRINNSPKEISTLGIFYTVCRNRLTERPKWHGRSGTPGILSVKAIPDREICFTLRLTLFRRYSVVKVGSLPAPDGVNRAEAVKIPAYRMIVKMQIPFYHLQRGMP